MRHVIALPCLLALSMGCSNRVKVDDIPRFGRAWSSAWLAKDYGDDTPYYSLVISSQTGICKKERKYHEQMAEALEAIEVIYELYDDDDVDPQEECEAFMDFFRNYSEAEAARFPGGSRELILTPMDDEAFPEEQEYETDEDDREDRFYGYYTAQPKTTEYELLAEIFKDVDCGDDDWRDELDDEYEEVEDELEEVDDSEDHGEWSLEDGVMEITKAVDEGRVKGTFEGDLEPTWDEDLDDGSLNGRFNASYCEIDMEEIYEDSYYGYYFY